MSDEYITRVDSKTLPSVFGAILGTILGLGVSGAVLFSSAKALQYYWWGM